MFALQLQDRGSRFVMGAILCIDKETSHSTWQWSSLLGFFCAPLDSAVLLSARIKMHTLASGEGSFCIQGRYRDGLMVTCSALTVPNLSSNDGI